VTSLSGTRVTFLSVIYSFRSPFGRYDKSGVPRGSEQNEGFVLPRPLTVLVNYPDWAPRAVRNGTYGPPQTAEERIKQRPHGRPIADFTLASVSAGGAATLRPVFCGMAVARPALSRLDLIGEMGGERGD
jgi:hypothetical protein